MPKDFEARAFAALQAGNGPVGGTRGEAVGVGVGLEVAEGEATGDGLVVSDGLGVGAARAGLENSANDRVATAASPDETLR